MRWCVDLQLKTHQEESVGSLAVWLALQAVTDMSHTLAQRERGEEMPSSHMLSYSLSLSLQFPGITVTFLPLQL